MRFAGFGLFALLVLLALACTHEAFAQDDATSSDSVTSTDSAPAPTDTAPSADAGANWDRVDPASPATDLATDSADKVLEIPQTACFENGAAVPCDERLSVNKPTSNNDNGDDASGGFAPPSPQTFDDNTASAGPIGSDSDWGTVDDYANQQVYGLPYGGGYGVASAGPIYGNPAAVPLSAFRYHPPMLMSAPLSPAARPPIGAARPWMTPPSMMTFSRPAGSPMAGRGFRLH